MIAPQLPILLLKPLSSRAMLSSAGDAASRPARSWRHRSNRRSGLTLIELLVGVTLSLLLIFAVVQIFEWMGKSLSSERAMIELSGQLRAATQRLQEDLDHLTCRPVTPWVDSAHAKGYFQYVEGRASDARYADGTQRIISGLAPDPDKLLATGDTDDLLAFTVYSDTPFVGRVVDPSGQSHQIESTRAEVVWWVAVVDVDASGTADPGEPKVLLRRQFLIRPDLADVTKYPALSATVLATPGTDGMFVSEISFGDGILNDLGTLTWPANRIGYSTAAGGRNLFPGLLLVQADSGDAEYPYHVLNGQRVPTLEQYGRYVVLSDLLAFDVRAYDPKAPVVVLNNANDAFAVMPGDVGYPADKADMSTTGNDNLVVGRGAYVDLNYLKDPAAMNMRVSLFSGGVNSFPSGGYSALIDGMLTATIPTPATYTTWPLDYERDGIDQNGKFGADEGINGVDDDGINGVDDLDERETMPPYPYPLRGIEVRLRMEDFSTRQVRQASVVGDFQTD